MRNERGPRTTRIRAIEGIGEQPALLVAALLPAIRGPIAGPVRAEEAEPSPSFALSEPSPNDGGTFEEEH